MKSQVHRETFPLAKYFFACCFCPLKRRQFATVNITVYLDESGQESQNYVIVSGFFGDEEQWKICAEKWREGLGRKQGLHMKELRFKKDRDRILLARLGPIPGQCGLTGVFGCIKASDYQDMIQGMNSKAANFESGMNAYVLCFMPILDTLRKTLKGYHKVKVVCENQERFARYVEFAFDYFASKSNRDPLCAYFSGVEFVPKDSTVLLQPADYLSFAIAHGFKDRHSRKSRWCQPIFEGNKMYGKTLSREEIRKAMGNTLKKLKLA